MLPSAGAIPQQRRREMTGHDHEADARRRGRCAGARPRRSADGAPRSVPPPRRTRRSTAIYLAGQSLGLQPRSGRAGDRDGAGRLGAPRRGRLVRAGTAVVHAGRGAARSDGADRGALPIEVALLNSLTVNIHLLLASFFRPDGRRRADPDRRPALPVRSPRADDPPGRSAAWTPSRTSSSSGPRRARHRPDRGPRGRHRRARPATSRWSSWPASTSPPARRSRSSG